MGGTSDSSVPIGKLFLYSNDILCQAWAAMPLLYLMIIESTLKSI